MNDIGRISVLFERLVDLMLVRGFSNIKDLPGCAEIRIDERWQVAVNGHSEATKCSHGPEIPAYAAYVQCNGWPAGIITPYGGVVAAGKLANEATLLEAIDAAIARGA